jgi:UPF0288 family protein (methanogenesis marker protein 3)
LTNSSLCDIIKTEKRKREKNMKVYVIIYDNGGGNYDYDEQVVAVVDSKEKAEEYKADENVLRWYSEKRIEEFILG